MNVLYKIMICFCLIPFTKHSSAQLNEDSDVLQYLKIQENYERCQKNSTLITSQDSLGENYCPKQFDGILCWNQTIKNKWSEQPCPIWFIGFYNTKGVAKRFCEQTAKWKTKKDKLGRETNITYTDYTNCVKSRETVLYLEHLPKVKLIARIGFSLSLASLTLAIILLSLLKRLHCPRNILHINLFASFLLFSTIQLIKELTWVSSVGFPKDVIEVQPKTYEMNPNVSHWECKLLMSLYRYAESSNHVMVFSEALYLNTLISVSSFNEDNHYKLYIAFGWIGPLLWFIPFISLMAKYYENSCWNIETRFTYLYVGPQVLLILSNFGMFINMIRVLVLKLKKNAVIESKNLQYRKLAKSTLIMLPLFSIYYIAFSVWQPFVTNKLTVEMELVRLYFEIICGSFQGMLISLIFCFFNSEVKSEIRKIIERKILEHDPLKQRRLSRFFSDKKTKNLIVSQNERLKNNSDKHEDLSPKSLYRNSNPRLTICTTTNTNKSRESSIFFPHNKKKSDFSNCNENEFKKKNLSINNLNLIVKLNEDIPVDDVYSKKIINKKSNSKLLNLLKRNQENKDAPKIKNKSKSKIGRIDSFKVIKIRLNKEKNNRSEEPIASTKNNLIYATRNSYSSINDGEDVALSKEEENFSEKKIHCVNDCEIQQMAES